MIAEPGKRAREGKATVDPSRKLALIAKRAMDVVIAGVVLTVLSPVMLLIALAVKLMDLGPVFFAWDILGIGGQPIRSYKFRSMVVGAEAMEVHFRDQGRNEMKSVYFKIRNDPRITPIGRLLRRFSLDETPSLWSVLKGEMSLVGPRPIRLVEVRYLKPWHYERFVVRPGLTSPWVVGGKGTGIRDFDHIATSDIEYIRRWSIWHDVKILLATLSYIASGTNH
jgi:lipopolysaccharide/colanic/teichoic acid biosynthesis glycosyltransferase